MPAPSTKIAPEQLIQAAKAPFTAYNNKDWKAARASFTSDFVYDEVPTGRKAKGADDVIALWKGWGTAFPDSKCTYHREYVSGNTVVLELTWKGTHTGPMQTPDGPIPATNKKIDIRACNVVEISGDKAKSQRQYFDMATMMQQLGLAKK